MDEVFKEKYRSKNLQVNTESFNKNCTNLKLSEIDVTENIESDYMRNYEVKIFDNLANFSKLEKEELQNNPWYVENIDEFLYFCCPECSERNQCKELFLEHALNEHPMAKEYLGKAI